ncbi:MAG: M20/M25/M40 family metallo-hydrolase [Thermoplasmata archaeon]|nr:M20/M25/M40 family metallo-hydrolase [Thermoplasmata archaeon]
MRTVVPITPQELMFVVAPKTIDGRGVLDLSRKLIQIPSVYGKETAIAEFIHSWMDENGFTPRKIDVPEHGPDIVASFGSKSNPKIVLTGHMDTVEVMNGWQHDPFGAVVEDGFLYGLGSLDMKCGLAAMMLAFRRLAESDLADHAHVCFQAVSGEERLGDGTRKLIESGELDGASAVIVGEGFGGLKVATIGRRGGSYYDIDVQGVSSHGAIPHRGVNAIEDASKVITAISDMPMSKTGGVLSDELRPLSESQTVLRISGGSWSLSVPEKCSIRVVRCTIPGGKVNISDEFVSVIDSLGLKSKVSVRLNTDPKELYHPYMTPANSPLVRAVSKVLNGIVGTEPTLVCGVSEADDNLIAHALKIPTICMGPGETGNLARYHQPEEAISVAQLGPAANAYYELVRELISGS